MMNAPGPDAKDTRRRGRFRKGISGNPAGRPAGSRNRITLALEALLEGEGEQITRKAIEMAKAGDKVALSLCMERLVPLRRDHPLRVELPELAAASSTAERLQAIIAAVADGRLAPSEGETLANMVKAKVEAEELDELRQRIWMLEQKAKESPQT